MYSCNNAHQHTDQKYREGGNQNLFSTLTRWQIKIAAALINTGSHHSHTIKYVTTMCICVVPKKNLPHNDSNLLLCKYPRERGRETNSMRCKYTTTTKYYLPYRTAVYRISGFQYILNFILLHFYQYCFAFFYV